jgi:ubiquinone/menaquinone biosynthesis C-methylase UbiE
MESLVDRFGHDDTPLVYTDRNPLVRELFWRRLGSLLALSRPPARERALDFGGGNGVLAPTLSRIYSEVYCVDLRTEMVEELREKDQLGNIRPCPGDILALGLPASSFDTIVAADVLEHIIDLPPLVAEFRRLLKPGGELLVSAPSENRFYEFGRRVFGYTKPEDHYHPASYIERTIAVELRPAARRYFPFRIAPLGVFLLGRFVKDRSP